MPGPLALALAIVSEVIATSALKGSESFTKPLPSLIVVVGYAAAFYLLSLTLRTIPIGIAYAIWSGVGIVLVTIIAWMMYGQRVGVTEIGAMGLIILGAVILNMRSATAG